jgi:hypothetical protein
MQINDVITIVISFVALVVSALSFRYARRSHLMATIPEASCELDYFTFYVPRETKPGKIEPLAPYTDMSVIIHNDSTNVRIVDVKIVISIQDGTFWGRRKEKVFVRFRPFFVDPGRRSERQKVFFDEKHPTETGYYRYGIEKFIATNFENLLRLRTDDKSKLPDHYEVVKDQAIAIKIKFEYKPGLFGASVQRRSKTFMFTPKHEKGILVGWQIAEKK